MDVMKVTGVPVARFIAGGCPYCGGSLANWSPAGHGVAACDNCQMYWEADEEEKCPPQCDGELHGRCPCAVCGDTREPDGGWECPSCGSV